MPLFRFSARLAAVFALAVSLAAAQPSTSAPPQPEAQWLVHSVGLEQGLSQAGVLATVQDRHGFLWFATQDGLNRFDGYTFRVFRKRNPDQVNAPALVGNVLQTLLLDRAGRMWFGTRDGGFGVWDAANGQVSAFLADQTLDGRKFAAVTDFLEDDGRMWVATLGAGLAAVVDGTLEPALWLGRPDQQAANHIHALARGENGDLWLGTEDGVWCKSGAAAPVAVPLPNNLDKPLQIMDMVWGPQGDLWIASLNAGLYRIDPSDARVVQHWRHDPNQPAGLLSNRLWCLLFDRDQRLWIGTMSHGVQQFDATTGSFSTVRESGGGQQMQQDIRVWSLFEDAAGNVWIGTAARGLLKAVPNTTPFVHAGGKTGDSGKQTIYTSVAVAADGGFWLGTWGKGLQHYDPRSKKLTPVVPAADAGEAAPQLITHLYQDEHGILWLGVWRRGLVRYDPARDSMQSFRWEADPDERPIYSVVRILPDGDGLWLATYGAGLVHFTRAEQRFTRYRADAADPNALSHGQVMALQHDADGRLWVGTVGGGVHRLDPATGRFERGLGAAGEITPGQRITALARGASGHMWIASEGDGLYRYDESRDLFENWRRRDGLPGDVVNGITFDGGGHVWLSTSRGLCRLNPDDGTVQSFGPRHGLQYEYVAGAYDRAADGTLIFAGTDGFDYFHPDWIQTRADQPPVAFTDFRIFNHEAPLPGQLATLKRLELNHRQNYFSFEFAALGFAFPEQVRYAYKLEGFDRDWVDAGTRRFVGYTNLNGGDYRLRVRATNSDGVWSPHEAAIDVRVVPPLWQRGWFWVVLVGLLLLLTAGGVGAWSQRRVRFFAQRAEQEAAMSRGQSEAREAERMRIARDLHDGPIQDLHAVQLRLSLAGGPLSRETDTYLRGVIQQLRRLCGELRPPAITQFGLGVAIRSLIETHQEKSPDLQFNLDLAEDRKHLDPEQRLALFRICQESINNAVQHARCQTISIRLRCRADGVTLVISDDGVGFQQQDHWWWLQKGRYGLLGMVERARALGGELTINSRPGAGCKVVMALHRPTERAAIA